MVSTKTSSFSFLQVVKMFIVVVIIFAVCWLPYHVYFIYTYHDTEIRRQPYIQHVYLGFYWLAMSNSMFNPLIYYWMNARSASISSNVARSTV